jgi:hypothetical protein
MTKHTNSLQRYITPCGHGVEPHPSGLLYHREEVDLVIEKQQAEILRLVAEVGQLQKALTDIVEVKARADALQEQIQEMIDYSEQTCGCGYDNPDDVCLGHWPAYKAMKDQLEAAQATLDIANKLKHNSMLAAFSAGYSSGCMPGYNKEQAVADFLGAMENKG